MSQLILVPTPLNDSHPLESLAFQELSRAVLTQTSRILVEEHKACRRRWLNWGLPREAIDNFILYNEHTREELCEEMVGLLKSGKNLFLLSDGGLPALFDPGRELVERCHDERIKVSSTPFAHSLALALALSGFDHHEYFTAGFLPQKNPERGRKLTSILRLKQTLLLMDTPYRLTKLLAELDQRGVKRRMFLATNLGHEDEFCLRGTCHELTKAFDGHKKEFILVLEGE